MVAAFSEIGSDFLLGYLNKEQNFADHLLSLASALREKGCLRGSYQLPAEKEAENLIPLAREGI